jgi:hypothetical protein
VTVARDRLPSAGRDHLGHALIGAQDPLRVSDDRLERRIGGGPLGSVHHDHQRGRGQAPELEIHGLTHRQRL